MPDGDRPLQLNMQHEAIIKKMAADNGMQGNQALSALVMVGARAFANGDDIAFSQGQANRMVMAHEAAHVVQQRNGQATPPPPMPDAVQKLFR